MKKTVLQLIFIFLLTTLTYSQTNVYDSISYGGRWRTYMTHLPTGYNVSKKYPLILAFHGGSPLGYQSFQYQSRLSEKSDSAGFIVVYPEGVKIAGNRTWNAGGCCAPATTLNIEDVGLVNSLLNTLNKTRSIDSTRVYATGFSNGALLGYKLANQLTRRFAAIAIVEGDFVSYPWQPSRPIPIISFHSYQDQNVKYNGGVTTGTTGTYFPPQDSMFSIISSNYSCSLKKETVFHDASKYDHFKYSNCSGNVVIEQYVSYDGEHSWPGGQSLSGVAVSTQFSATYLMWKFFQNYSINLNTDIEVISDKPDLTNYAFTFSNRINPDNLSSEGNYNLLNSLGQVIWSGKNIKEKDFTYLTKGLYFLKSEKMMQKLLKQ